MKRWMVMAAVLATTMGGLGVTEAQAQAPRGPIVIDDNQFTIAKGVTNAPHCGGFLQPACSIDHWQITPAPGQACITISDTTRNYIVRDNQCRGGTMGVVLTRAPHGQVVDNTISGLNGTAAAPEAIGIQLDTSNDMSITDNELSNVHGRPGTTAGQDGADAFGIHVRDSDRVEILRNTISLVTGGYGYLAAFGGSGGDGGEASAIFAEQTTVAMMSLRHWLRFVSGLLGPVSLELGPVSVTLPIPAGLTLENNSISRVWGGVGAVGGYSGTGTGGTGGNGGGAVGVSVRGLSNSSRYSLRATSNNITLVLGAVGAVAGAGLQGGQGGHGGSGQGMSLTNVVADATVSGNVMSQLYGGFGGAGAFGAVDGGNGGNGGDGVGIRKGNVTPTGTVITFFVAGFGGIGGFPLGLPGSPGTAAAVL